MAFYARENELNLMQRAFGARGQNMVLVYGRRRVGKSELIKQALSRSEARSIYYECKKTSEENNLESLSVLVSEAQGLPRLPFRAWRSCSSFSLRNQANQSSSSSSTSTLIERDSPLYGRVEIAEREQISSQEIALIVRSQ